MPESAIAASATNVPELTVGELSGALKRTIEDRFGFVRVRGEISNYRGPHSSGHAYFSLKDDTARIDAVVWRSTFLKLKTKPQEGLEVIATGKVTTFPGKSAYQIVIEAIEPAGVGALMALLDARRKALAAEGLFDVARKRALPFLPGVIGVITSPTGAVIRDILHRVSDRFPRHVLVWPVRVQGETAAEEVAAAIAGFNALSPGGAIPRPDVLIVARGGGSLEDLWAFNEEIVVRAAAASVIPLIAAIGHETDVTLIDHAADLRAPTPSSAAEKAVPVRADLLGTIGDLARRHAAAMRRTLDRRRQDARALARALPSADTVTAVPRQKLDRAEERLASALAGAGHRRQLELARLADRLSRQAPRTRLAKLDQSLSALERRLASAAVGSRHRRQLEWVRLADRLSRQTPGARIARQSQVLSALEQRLSFQMERAKERRTRQLGQSGQRLQAVQHVMRRDMDRRREQQARAATALRTAMAGALDARRDGVGRIGKLLATLGYRQVLARGYALVRSGRGLPLRTAHEAAAETILDIEFADGHISVNAPGLRGKARRPKAEQGSLF